MLNGHEPTVSKHGIGTHMQKSLGTSGDYMLTKPPVPFDLHGPSLPALAGC